MDEWLVAPVPPRLRLRRTFEWQGLRLSVRLLLAGIGWVIGAMLLSVLGVAFLRSVQLCGVGLALSALWLEGRWAGRPTARAVPLLKRVLRRPPRLAWRRTMERVTLAPAAPPAVLRPRWRQEEVRDGG
ncbi:MAG TPA: hypothetical protein VGE07_25825 [Herpetosiphonaceae bacterium]